MNNNLDNIFLLCRERLYEREIHSDTFLNSEIDYVAVKEIMAMNSLSAFLYKPLKAYNDNKKIIDDDELVGYGQYTQMVMLHEIKKNHAIRMICNEAERRGLYFVFFKGILIADLYPQYAERTSSDSDILVNDVEKNDAEQLLNDCGYVKDEESSKNHVQVYYNSKFDHTVELHTRLWEDYEGPRINALKKMKLSCPETNIRTTACGIEVNTLGYEKHLVFQLFHIIKHFSLNGVGIRYLIDIALFVNKYFDEIDFDVFWNHMDELGYTKFVEAFFRLCITELKMTDKVFANHNASFDYSVEDLKIDLLKVGNINDKEAGWQIMGAMEAYFTGEADVPRSKLSKQLSMMFPSAKAMPKTYEYARKYPILLPFAWMHRDIKYLIRKSAQKDEMYSVTEKIEVAEKRLRLIEELGLTEK
ncbi:nucleotidyltransferase domain-containing protein [Butyrivibrio sp. FC2001]|uniref:nucleotidyltransferase domain-containing protein n=1 Tax=Butyrivibrio sp. FC2001 TaxID=1280671 RepID=UPI00047CF1E6|nr:nucleotidyltransferase family protein [Butyrivibrio sp. FC2001]